MTTPLASRITSSTPKRAHVAAARRDEQPVSREPFGCLFINSTPDVTSRRPPMGDCCKARPSLIIVVFQSSHQVLVSVCISCKMCRRVVWRVDYWVAQPRSCFFSFLRLLWSGRAVEVAAGVNTLASQRWLQVQCPVCLLFLCLPRFSLDSLTSVCPLVKTQRRQKYSRSILK